LLAKIDFIVVLGWSWPSWVKLLEKNEVQIFKPLDHPVWGDICPHHPDADPAKYLCKLFTDFYDLN